MTSCKNSGDISRKIRKGTVSMTTFRYWRQMKRLLKTDFSSWEDENGFMVPNPVQFSYNICKFSFIQFWEVPCTSSREKSGKTGLFYYYGLTRRVKSTYLLENPYNKMLFFLDDEISCVPKGWREIHRSDGNTKNRSDGIPQINFSLSS